MRKLRKIVDAFMTLVIGFSGVAGVVMAGAALFADYTLDPTTATGLLGVLLASVCAQEMLR